MAYLTPDFIDRYKDANPGWGFNGLGYIVYKRTYARPIPEEGRTEEWHETVGRVVNGAIEIGAGFEQDEAEALFEDIFYLRAIPGGRMLWQLGTDNVKRLGGDSLVNCWYTNLTEVADFGWMFERLMLGGGVGFSVADPEAFGVVRQGHVLYEEDAADSDFIVPDKREGWADLLTRTLRCYLPKRDSDYAEFSYSTAMIRPEGAPIKTFGGTASGPGILVEGVAQICSILDGAVGRHLSSVELLDIGNVIGSVVVSGNVRRSAQIALGSATDEDYMAAKRWDIGTIPAYRAMSNNSVFVEDYADLPANFWDGYEGKGEAYGLVNVEAAQRYGRIREDGNLPDGSIEGFNPCGEIALAHRESCNLAELVLPRFESQVKLSLAATRLYKIQKAVAGLRYLDPYSDFITSANRRLGLGVTGVAQASGEQLGWLDQTYNELREFDTEWSDLHGYPESVRLTTVKPSGTLSLLAGVTPGVHPGFAQYHIRRVRMAYNDPLVQYCQSKGIAWEWQRDFDGEEDRRTVVLSFPCEFPESTVFADDMSAIEQLQLQARMQKDWADNAVSTTVYFEPDELGDIKRYLAKFWSTMKSVSFLLKSEHGFDQAPLEAISKARYDEMLASVSEAEVAVGGGLSELLDADCDTGACPIR